MIDLTTLTGRGSRIAIVDTGISPDHPHVGRVIDGFGVDIAGDIPRFSTDWSDRHGHGTACAGVVRWIAPEADILAARVLDASLAGRSPALVAALDRLAGMNVQVVCLSLGSTDEEARVPLERAARRLIDQGALMVAAARPDGSRSWPADQDGVIGVEADPSLTGWAYVESARAGIDFAAAPFPRPIPDRPESMNFAGPSFAAPRIAALACRAVEGNRLMTLQNLLPLLRESAHAFRHRPNAQEASRP